MNNSKMESKLIFDFKTNQQIIKKIAFIDFFKGKWRSKRITVPQRIKANSNNRKYSFFTRIEGSTLTDKEVKQLIDSVNELVLLRNATEIDSESEPLIFSTFV